MRNQPTPPASAPNVDAYLRVHRALRQSARQLAAATADPHPTSARALARWYHGFADEIRLHHRIEDDLLFPALAARVATYCVHGPKLDADHVELDELLDELGTALDVGDRAAAARMAGDLREHFDDHLGYEDDEIVPLFIRHFTGAEFAELDAKAIAMTPPRQLVFTAPWLVSHLDDAERAELLASVPRAVKVLWVLCRGRYARLAAKALGGGLAAPVGR